VRNGSAIANIQESLAQQMGRQTTILFDGQQEGEVILFSFLPHRMAFWLSTAKLIFGLTLLAGLIWAYHELIPYELELIYKLGLAGCLGSAVVGVWWLNKYYSEAWTYITDRRVVRFEPVFPIFFKKRNLFWANVLKSKAVSTNYLLRMLKIGTVVISPIFGDEEDIHCKYSYYYEDLTNYVDKILFLSKHSPNELQTMREFILKPKGARY